MRLARVQTVQNAADPPARAAEPKPLDFTGCGKNSRFRGWTTDSFSMNTDVQKKEPAQRGHINLSEPAELRFWAEHFGVSEKEILEAVKQVGGAVDEVKKYLKK